MFINEYGDKNNPLVLLLAPMMVSGEDLYQLMYPYFKHDYHYIAPDQGPRKSCGTCKDVPGAVCAGSEKIPGGITGAMQDHLRRTGNGYCKRLF